MKIAIYTAIIGDYEAPRDPIFMDKDIDYILFTDKRTESKKWDVRYIQHSGLTPRKSARAVKILSHQYLPEYDLTIWVDANFCQKKSLMPLIEKMEKDITLLKHPVRNCVYAEARTCLDGQLDYSEVINEQMYFYQQIESYPSGNGLVATGLILRKNTEEIQKLNEDWWHEVLGKSGRDQLSFNYCAWVNGVEFEMIPFNTLYEYFDHSKHKAQRVKLQ